MLWLTWFAAFLDAAAEYAPISKAAEKIGHAWLARIERLIVAIVIVRVAARAAGVNKRKGVPEHRRKDAGIARAIVGSRLRRALRSKNLHLRIAALRQDIDALVTAMLKRLPRGLTRRRPIKACRNRTAGAPAGIFPHMLNQAGEGAGGPVADTS